MIIQPENLKLLKELSRTQYGKALKDYLEQSIKEIGDITKSESWEETLGRKFALRLINDLFHFMREENIKDKDKNPYV